MKRIVSGVVFFSRGSSWKVVGGHESPPTFDVHQNSPSKKIHTQVKRRNWKVSCLMLGEPDR